MAEDPLAEGIVTAIIGSGAVQVGKEAVTSAARQFSRMLGRSGKNADAAVSEIERRSVDGLGDWADVVRRGVAAELLVRFFGRVKRIMQEKGIEDSEVPPKILFPILAEATQQSDETLQEMWAGLLASAASGNGMPIQFYTSLLKQLDPIEGRLMDAIYPDSGIDWSEDRGRKGRGKHAPLLAAELRADVATVYVLRGHLEALGLLNSSSGSPQTLSLLGAQLVRACRTDVEDIGRPTG